jgi:hypothetical protein
MTIFLHFVGHEKKKAYSPYPKIKGHIELVLNQTSLTLTKVLENV